MEISHVAAALSPPGLFQCLIRTVNITIFSRLLAFPSRSARTLRHNGVTSFCPTTEFDRIGSGGPENHAGIDPCIGRVEPVAQPVSCPGNNPDAHPAGSRCAGVADPGPHSCTSLAR